MDLLFSSGIMVYTGSCFSGIYGIQCHENNKWYVGESIHVPDRMDNYLKQSSNIKSQVYLNNAFNKYGIVNFSAYKLEECVVEQLHEREVYWGTRLNSIVPNGYNLKLGGSGKSIVSDHSKEKMRVAGKAKVFTDEHKKNISLGQAKSKNMVRNTGKKLNEEIKNGASLVMPDEYKVGRVGNMRNKQHSKETKLKMSITRTGKKKKPMSEEGRRNISESRKGKFSGENSPRFGKQHTDASKEKNRASQGIGPDNKRFGIPRPQWVKDKIKAALAAKKINNKQNGARTKIKSFSSLLYKLERETRQMGTIYSTTWGTTYSTSLSI